MGALHVPPEGAGCPLPLATHVAGRLRGSLLGMEHPHVEPHVALLDCLKVAAWHCAVVLFVSVSDDPMLLQFVLGHFPNVFGSVVEADVALVLKPGVGLDTGFIFGHPTWHPHFNNVTRRRGYS